CARRSATASRSANERYRLESGLADGLNIDGGRPPAFLNHRVPTAPATHLPRLRHPHSPYRPQSPPRTAGSRRVLSPVGDQVRTAAPVPTAAFDFASQLPFRGCCDDHLNPPNTSRFATPSACLKLASNRLSAASETATTTRSPRRS